MGAAVSNSASAERTQYTAIDFVTLAVFAALYRAMWYVWSALGFLFPFNQLLNGFFMILAGVAAVTIVRKRWSFSLFAVATQLINLFIQGELLIAAVLFLSWGILGDLYTYFRLRAGADPFRSFRDMFVVGFLNSVTWVVTVILISFPFMFMIELPVTTYAVVAVACLISSTLGGAVGYGLGTRINEVM